MQSSLLNIMLRAIFFAAIFGQALANTLYPGSTLYRSQSILSSTGNYRLTMQSDGNLVMYRSDGSVRYSMASGGWIAVMQNDGNFVEYNSMMYPRWSTNTWGNPDSVLAIQDDGNLVVYSPTRGPIWSIGADNRLENPTKRGDVVGRDLDVILGGPLGHIGLWEGNYVIEADYGAYKASGNALRTVAIEDFKRATSIGASLPQKFQASG